jgi:hypothetical protein
MIKIAAGTDLALDIIELSVHRLIVGPRLATEVRFTLGGGEASSTES